ncbi:hypothetical protein B0T14DRAFT_104137 [Immersiella caudata]|uniref:Uncharacterized protein n=1 Tax=Immersiella caudata TaxID=314043 RepID=A0AA40C6X4_9PEZI|nr:hypothetical protein B0T14DRAFT_104137 [Immersiella caudata]
MSPEPEEPPAPGTPKRTAKNGIDAPTTPANRRASAQAGATPKSAPAAAGRKKPEPSLLADFLLGRPSAARTRQRSASTQRRKSVALDAAGVREELRQEMKAAAVRRLQQPNGVHARVKQWQKTNMAAMKAEGGGIPHAEDVASEPTEIGAHIDDKTVTEEDRVRIKFRKKPRRPKAKVESGEPKDEGDEVDEEDDQVDEPDVVAAEPVQVTQPKERPKKRIVSDSNWMKRNKGKEKAKSEGSPTPIPKDFLQRTAQNPKVQDKIKDWAKRVELPDPVPMESPKPRRVNREEPRLKQYHTKSGETVTVEEDGSSVADQSQKAKPRSDPLADDGIRVKPVKPRSDPLEDDGIRVKPVKLKKYKPDPGDGIRIIPMRKKELPGDDGIRVTPTVSSSSLPDDGIRVTPTVSSAPLPDDGIRVTPTTSSTSLPDDGIRVRPIKADPPDDGIRIRPGRRKSVDESTVRGSSSSSRSTSVDRSTRVSGARRDRSPADVIEVFQESETEINTPTRRQASGRQKPRQSRGSSPRIRGNKAVKPPPSEVETSVFTERDGGSDNESEIPPTIAGGKSLADIPVGYSAFSVLDLPSTRNSAKKPKAQRNPSFKAVPNVLKKVMTGAKEMIQEKVEPPKPVNQPPSIEKWLNNTVDPFVEPIDRKQPVEEKRLEHPKRSVSQPRQKEVFEETRKRSVSQPRQKEVVDEPKRRSVSQTRQEITGEPRKRSVSNTRPKEAKETAPEPQNRSASQARRSEPLKLATAFPAVDNKENTDSKQDDSDTTPKKATAAPTPSPGLKRRRATRSASSPVKPNGKKPFREALKEAFRGESGGHKLPPMVYPSCETDYESALGPEDEESEFTEVRDNRRHSSGSSRRSHSPDPLSTVDSTLSSDYTDPYPSRRRPPTKGNHALSTILSEEASTVISDTISDISHTTITQETAFTKSTDISRRKSSKSSLKRRLTKHSDLVSVLSLPGEAHLHAPNRSRSIKSSHSLHRKPSKASKNRIDDLLDEFSDDEYFYNKELKTLVDGVVPVLLKDVIRSDSSKTAGGFARKRDDATVKAVINMGVTLERLRNLHRSVPLSDIRHLLTWLETVAVVYDDYLDVWRLGFQDLIVNLAPAGRFDDEDSLVGALPRNEDGDVLGEHGERVDVAYLLKRPLVRIKWITKFLKAAVMAMETREADDLLARYESLQENARKRHKEEVARMTDEDANNTDTTRARDLRNLAPLDGVMIDQSRQVAAKDSFEMDLDHSSGQRLECQVELIHRDKPDYPADKGDILVREVGNGSQSWLLFPPIPRERVSARRGESNHALIVMVRGAHNRQEWSELIKLITDSEDQILDWLDILGSYPLPPLTKPLPIDNPPSTPTRSDAVDIPVGERRFGGSDSASSTPEKAKTTTPSRYRTVQSPDAPRTPSSPTGGFPVLSPERTPTRETYAKPSSPGRRLPTAPDGHTARTWDNAHRDPVKSARAAPNSTPFREDGAPPPPIHRTLTVKSPSQQLPAPVDTGLARVKRRGSSPLKHEYHPSDVSSDSSSATSDSSESSESSSDELGEDEVPDTIPGYSIRKLEPASAESVVSESSITPSASASQVGARSQTRADGERPSQKFVASVSYWSTRKGQWKDIETGQLSIVVYPGSLEVHRLSPRNSQTFQPQSGGTSEVDNRDKGAGGIVPLVGLILTPVVMIRRSTALDLEIRSPESPESKLKTGSAMFRLRAPSQAEAKDLYEAVHRSRLNNARYIQLSEEARVRSFGTQQNGAVEGSADGDSSSRRRSFFGRKNSYRASTRAPSLSLHSGSTSISATSFLRRLTGGGNTSFNIDESSVDKHSRPGSLAGPGGGSLESSSGSSTGALSTPPRSVSISLSGSGASQSRWSNGLAKPFSPDSPLEIRCHLNVQNNRWADKGDCILHISQPPPGVRQELRLYHGMEKRVIVTHMTKKTGDKATILLDAVLGSKCFSMLGARGIMCSVWENLRDEEGNVGMAPAQGALAGRVTKWCFQCKSAQQARMIMGLVTSEVPGLMGN